MRPAPGLLGLLSYLARPASDFQTREISRRTRTTPPSRGRVGRNGRFLLEREVGLTLRRTFEFNILIYYSIFSTRTIMGHHLSRPE